MEEEHRKQLPSHHLWKLTDILNLARIGEIQEKKAAEGDKGILLAFNSKAEMELAQLPMQNYSFCHGDLLRQAVESSSEDSVPTACISVYSQLFSERAQPLHIGSASPVGSLQNQGETEQVIPEHWVDVAQHVGVQLCLTTQCCDNEKQ